jgi:HlyD family secretion protein
MLKYGLPVLAVLVLSFAVFSIGRTQPVRKMVPPPSIPPVSAYEKEVGAVGLVEASSENISISLPVPGLVTRVYVKAGDQVRKGDKLFSLDDRDLVAELALRQSEFAVAQAKLKKLLDSPRPEEIPAAEARVHEAEQSLHDAEVQLQLIESVRDKRAIREEDLLRRRIAAGAAKARLEQANADLTLLKAGAWQPDIDVEKSEVAEAQHQVGRTQADINRLTVTSPIDGEILQCKIRAGEYAQAGPLAQPLILMGDIKHFNVRADIDEQDAWRVEAGADAVASPRGLGAKRYALHFVRFEPYVVPKKNLTNDTTERVDTRVLQAVFALDRGAPVWAGQQMDVFIRTK